MNQPQLSSNRSLPAVLTTGRMFDTVNQSVSEIFCVIKTVIESFSKFSFVRSRCHNISVYWHVDPFHPPKDWNGSLKIIPNGIYLNAMWPKNLTAQIVSQTF